MTITAVIPRDWKKNFFRLSSEENKAFIKGRFYGFVDTKTHSFLEFLSSQECFEYTKVQYCYTSVYSPIIFVTTRKITEEITLFNICEEGFSSK
jgi:regulation of enolase protein 1 (concanavalin A-like superfamily)